MSKVFSGIYKENFWNDPSSVSGPGSNLKQTAKIRKALPDLLHGLEIKSILDIPCGDYFWWQRIKKIPDIEYIGGDVVAELIYNNRKNYPDVDFRILDITADALPKVDAIFVRDLFGHLTDWQIQRALRNIKLSDAKYLIATTFPNHATGNTFIEEGQWHAVNLASFYGLPDPIALIDDGVPGQFSDKSLGVWELE